MRLRELNALSAIASLAGCLVWFAMGQYLSGLIWLACSVCWFALAVTHLRSADNETRPLRRLGRRFLRLLLWS